jgi:hypothetical protein
VSTRRHGRQVLAVLVFIGILNLWLLSDQIRREPIVAQWSFDLADAGYPSAKSWRDTHFTLKSSSEGVSFIDNRTVVAYFVTKDDITEFSNRKDVKQGSPFRLRAVFGDLSGRKVTSTKDWPTREFQSWLMPTSDGKFVVRAAESLQLYSPDFSLVKEYPLEATGRRFESWHVEASPSGKVLWIDDEGDGKSRIQVLDMNTLNQLAAWDEQLLGGWFSVSNQAIAKSPVQNPQRVNIKSVGGPWHILYEKPETCVNTPNFVNDEMLISGPCGTVGLISTSGEILMTDKLPKGEHLEGEIAASRNGKIAAVSLMRTKGGAFDTAIQRSATEVVVYDLEQRRAILKVKVDPLPKSSYHFALSPDGASLAVMTDSIVKIYDTGNPPAERNDAKALGK